MLVSVPSLTEAKAIKRITKYVRYVVVLRNGIRQEIEPTAPP